MKHRFMAICLVVSTALAAVSCYDTNSDKNVLSPRAFEAGIDSGNVQLVDVRTPQEYEKSYITGAVLANWNDRQHFRRITDSLDKHKPVYIYCGTGKRSAEAAGWMRQNGFDKVYELEGGKKNLDAWLEQQKTAQ